MNLQVIVDLIVHLGVDLTTKVSAGGLVVAYVKACISVVIAIVNLCAAILIKIAAHLTVGVSVNIFV